MLGRIGLEAQGQVVTIMIHSITTLYYPYITMFYLYILAYLGIFVFLHYLLCLYKREKYSSTLIHIHYFIDIFIIDVKMSTF